MDIDVPCNCGNPECNAEVSMRQCDVYSTSPDGKQAVEHDWLHIDAKQWDEKSGKSNWVELMVSPRDARCLTLACPADRLT